MATLTLEIDLLQRFLASLNYRFDGTPGHRNLLGIRSATAAGDTTIRSASDVTDLYNDTLVLFGAQQDGQPLLRCYRGSVDPGWWSTLHPAATLPAWRRGCAHLINGQYRYRLGTHKGYQALNQAEKVAVWRDMNRNYMRDGKDFVERGFFGINIHAGGSGTKVGAWSAGCSVLWGGRYGNAWKSFIELMRTSPAHDYWYTVIDAADLIEFAHAGAGNVDPDSADLPQVKRQALQEVLSGIALLYGYEHQAELVEEGGVSFEQLLNRLRQAGPLANVRLLQRPPVPPAANRDAARVRLLDGFRLIYGNLVAAGLDHAFHAQLNQLRGFGPLEAS